MCKEMQWRAAGETGETGKTGETKETTEIREALPAAFLSYIMRVEGGYVNHPKDPGGATKYGITQRSLEKARGMLEGLPDSVRDLSCERASRIFYAFYYLPAGCAALPYPLRLAHFDGAVHCGVHQGGRLLQRMLNRLGLGLEREEPLKVDGLVGPRTLERVLLLQRSGDFWGHLGVQGLLLERMEFYGSLARKNPKQYGPFLGGWLRRLELLRETAEERWKCEV